MNRKQNQPASAGTLESVTRPGRVIRKSAAAVVSFVPGSTWLLDDAPIMIQHQLSISEVLVRTVAGGYIKRAAISALRPVAPQTSTTGEGAAAKPIEAHSPKQWQRALEKEAKVRALLAGGDLSPKARAPVAEALGMSDRQLRRAIRRFRELDSPAAFLPLKPGAAQGTSRVNPKVESLIRDEITRALRDSPDVAVDDLYPVLRDSAKALRLRPPGRSTVARRLQQARANTDLLPAKIAEELRYKQRPVRGAIEAEGPLSIVEIDHTIADVHIVETNSRRPIGRPVLTLMIDRVTRVILGMVLTLEAPSRYTVGLCVYHAVMPKDDWLRRLGIPDACWPALGLMRRIFTDNAQEFHSMSLQRACQVYGIEMSFRPPGHPAAGGIIERAIGTFMTKIRLLPGSSYSKLLGEAPKNADRDARLTLAELEVYIAREISRYHKTPHSTLGMPPLTAWEQMGVINGEPVAPRLPADTEQFRLSFLPGEWRTITREGVELHGLRYQSEELRPWVRQRHKAMVRFDPTNLSEVYVETSEGHIATPLIRGGGMPFSLWEWREVRAQQIANGRMRDEHAVAAELLANRQLIADKASRSNRLRDVRRQARQDSWPSEPSPRTPQTNMISASPMDGELSCRVGR